MQACLMPIINTKLHACLNILNLRTLYSYTFVVTTTNTPFKPMHAANFGHGTRKPAITRDETKAVVPSCPPGRAVVVVKVYAYQAVKCKKIRQK